MRYAELVVPRVLELTYTAHDLQGFAQDLGYDGPPFPWDEERRHLPQVRARRYLRSHVPTRPFRSGVDTGRTGSVFIIPWVETQRDCRNLESTARSGMFSKPMTSWPGASYLICAHNFESGLTSIVNMVLYAVP